MYSEAIKRLHITTHFKRRKKINVIGDHREATRKH